MYEEVERENYNDDGTVNISVERVRVKDKKKVKRRKKKSKPSRYQEIEQQQQEEEKEKNESLWDKVNGMSEKQFGAKNRKARILFRNNWEDTKKEVLESIIERKGEFNNLDDNTYLVEEFLKGLVKGKKAELDKCNIDQLISTLEKENIDFTNPNAKKLIVKNMADDIIRRTRERYPVYKNLVKEESRAKAEELRKLSREGKNSVIYGDATFLLGINRGKLRFSGENIEMSITTAGIEKNFRKFARNLKNDGYERKLEKDEVPCDDPDLERWIKYRIYHKTIRQMGKRLCKDDNHCAKIFGKKIPSWNIATTLDGITNSLRYVVSKVSLGYVKTKDVSYFSDKLVKGEFDPTLAIVGAAMSLASMVSILTALIESGVVPKILKAAQAIMKGSIGTEAVSILGAAAAPFGFGAFVYWFLTTVLGLTPTAAALISMLAVLMGFLIEYLILKNFFPNKFKRMKKQIKNMGALTACVFLIIIPSLVTYMAYEFTTKYVGISKQLGTAATIAILGVSSAGSLFGIKAIKGFVAPTSALASLNPLSWLGIA
jgi:hypothetical protein